MISLESQLRIATLCREHFRLALAKKAIYSKPANGQRSLWTEEDEQKHPRDDHGRWAHTMSRGEFHQQEKVKPGYDLTATNKTYWAAVKQAASEGKEIHPKADEEHRQIFGEGVPRPKVMSQADYVGAREAMDPALQGRVRGPGGNQSSTTHEQALKREASRVAEADQQRDERRREYQDKVQAGELRPPTRRERLEQTASGHPDNPSVQAARRLLAQMDSEALTAESPIAAKLRASIKKALVEDFGEKIGGARKDAAQPLGSRGKKAGTTQDSRPAWARRYNISRIEKSTNKSEEGKWSVTDEKDKSAWGIPREKGQFDSKEAAEQALPLIAVTRNHRVRVISGNMTDDNREFGIVRNITDRKRATVKGGFKTEDEANRYMATHAEQIIEHQFPRYEDFAYLDHVERHGPEHKTSGNDVTPADFQKAFQFRGGEFGNWQSGKDGVTSLNHAYDALHDLSDALGLPAKAVALNGDLAIAFGARGTGGKNSARAHYEPNARVMNLTKMKGAGSLAHEWSHALDWHLGNGEHAISDPSYKTKLRPEVAEAAKALRNAMNGKQIDRAVQAPKAEADEVAELRAKYPNAEPSTLRVVGPTTVAGHLHNIKGSMNDIRRWKAERSKKPFSPLSEADNKEWDDLSVKIASGDVGAKMSDDGGRLTYEHVDQLNKLFKKHAGQSFHTGNWKTPSAGHYLVSNIDRKQLMEKRAKEAEAGVVEKRTVPTDFANEAVNLDLTQVGNYYSLPHEMFARAFEAYVADKLHEKGIRSDYLVSRAKTDNRAYAVFNMKPFPEGEERKAINAAFDNFFAALKHQPRQDDKGSHVQIYSRERVENALRRGIECYSLRSDIRQAAAITDVTPSREQVKAGNYRKGRFRLWGLEVVIENPQGSMRSGCDQDGKRWSIEVPAHYGYIRQHISEADGDHVDVYIGTHLESEVVFIVDQQNPDDGRFDEHKCFIGFRSAREVERTYLAAFARGGKARRRLGSIATMTKAQFLEWLDNGDTSRPVCGTASVVKYSRVTQAVNQSIRLGRVERYAKFDPDKHPREEDGRWARKRGRNVSAIELQGHADVAVSIASGAVPKTHGEARGAGLGLRGEYQNLDTGWSIHVFADGIKDTVSRHGFPFEAINAIPDLLKNAVRFASEDYVGDQAGIARVHHFYSPLRLSDGIRLASLVVLERKDGTEELWDYRLRNLGARKAKRLTSATAASNDSTSSSVSGSGEPLAMSIGLLIDAVKEFRPEHVHAGVSRDAYSRCVDSLTRELYAARRSASHRIGEVMQYRAISPPSRPAWLKPKVATQQPEQRQPSKSKPSATGGWQKVGGSSVFVNSAGRITKGCPGLKGHHVGELIDESDESRDRRAAKQAHAESRGLTGRDLTATAANKLGTQTMVAQHVAAKTAAKASGVGAVHVLGRMADAKQLHAENTGRLEELKARARYLTGMNAGVLSRIENAHRDHSTVPRFDEAVASLQEEYPDVNFGDDPADFVWQAMRQGKVRRIGHSKVAAEAARMVSASGSGRSHGIVDRMVSQVSRAMAAATVAEDTSFSFGANAAF